VYRIIAYFSFQIKYLKEAGIHSENEHRRSLLRKQVLLKNIF